METKICTKCGEAKELDLFYADKSKKDGKRNQCKECRREYDRKRRLENPEKAREDARKWRLENLEKYSENKRKWRLENSEKLRELKRKWRLENLETVSEKERERARKRRLENPEKGSENKRKWRSELKTGYVKELLRAEFKIPNSEITPLDVKEKREQIQFHRQIKSLTKQLKQNENKS